jgi:hypothetical protein
MVTIHTFLPWAHSALKDDQVVIFHDNADLRGIDWG